MKRAPRAFATACLLLFAVAAGLIATDRLDAVAALGVPTMTPRFADVRPITGAAVALAEGLDPLRDNPGDPWQRALNYPRVWLLLPMLGVGPAASEALAIVFLLVFAAGVLATVRLATTPARAAAMAVALWSPVTWLAIERANSDVVVFALLAAAALLWARRPGAGTAVVGGAAALKLYPVFAGIALLGVPRARAVRLGAALAVAFAGYLAWLQADLALIRANSLAWNRISYGITQLPDALAANTGWPRTPLLVAATTLVAATAGVALWARRRWQLPAAPGAALHAFRIGAAVFVGTFCLGSNFDYRLLALLLTVPQVVSWCGSTRGAPRLCAVVLLAALGLLFWSMTWRAGLGAALGSETPGLIADELVTWTAVATSIVALGLSVPAADAARTAGCDVTAPRTDV